MVRTRKGEKKIEPPRKVVRPELDGQRTFERVEKQNVRTFFLNTTGDGEWNEC